MPDNQPTTPLEALPPAVRQALKAKKYTVKYLPGAQILRQEDDSKDVFFINYGKVLVTFYTERGDKLSFAEMRAGQSFGELSAIDLKPRSANVLAVEETSLTRIGHLKFQSLLKAHPGFSHFVMCQMSAMIRRLHNRMYDLRALDSTHRIYAELLRLAENGEIDGRRITINNPPTHAEIAARINSHREAISRTYRKLIKDSLLEKRSKQLIIIDSGVLQQRIDDYHGRK